MAEKLGPGFKETLLTVFAKDIMQKDVVWGSPDDSVQQAHSKIQQNNAGYIMVGREQVLEGIVSKSDITGALSPYLKNIFAKWRRPMDDATLQIKIKWIMSKPTCTINLETSLAKIMENMYQTDKKCLPVVDDQGKVRGVVTVFDIFRALLKHSCPK
jgi:CBS-domain-containing membrane protein